MNLTSDQAPTMMLLDHLGGCVYTTSLLPGGVRGPQVGGSCPQHQMNSLCDFQIAVSLKEYIMQSSSL
jgi:hypothetical protein